MAPAIRGDVGPEMLTPEPLPEFSVESELSRAHTKISVLDGRITSLQAEIIEFQRAALAGMRGVLQLPELRDAAMVGTPRTRELYLGALASDYGRVMLEKIQRLEESDGEGRAKAKLGIAWLEGAAKMRSSAAKLCEAFALRNEDGVLSVVDPRDIASDIRALSLVPFEEE